MKHTPTPWRIGESAGGKQFIYGNGESNQPIVIPNARATTRHTDAAWLANAEFIVEAVNFYADWLESNR
jgi:hypothetical protein